MLTLYRLRRKLLCTNNSLALTRGSPVGPVAMLTHFDPTRGIFTGVCPSRNGQSALVGQVIYAAGERSARISYLLPADGLDHPALSYLLEALAETAGSWGAFHLLAEIDEFSTALDPVRDNGYNVYAWQTIWKFQANEQRHADLWQAATPTDEVAVRSLYQLLVPPLVQSAEPFPMQVGQRQVYRQDGDILAYADVLYGPQGIYLQPVVHPAVENLDAVLGDLFARQPSLPQRPLYVAARSYQAWLEPSLRRLQGAPSPRYAMLVKHLAVAQRAVMLARQPVRELYNPEATVPLIQHSTINDN